MAKQYAKQEEEAIAKGEYEEVLVDQYECKICKKIFKNEKQMENHLQSKKHIENFKKFMDSVTLDDETERIILEEKERMQRIQEEKNLEKRGGGNKQ